MFSLFIVEPVYICYNYMNCLTVTYRSMGSGVQLFVSLSQLLYNLTCHYKNDLLYLLTMIGRSPRCYIPSFGEIGPLVSEKIFEGFLPYGHGGHLGHVTSIILIYFHFNVPKSLHTEFG